MKTLIGTVVATATPQTAQVAVTRQWQHPVYLKSVKRTKRYACHLDGVTVALGNVVEIQECRPISKTKRFRVSQVIAATDVATQSESAQE
jgi:small subunit ribosomal protein S17